MPDPGTPRAAALVRAVTAIAAHQPADRAALQRGLGRRPCDAEPAAHRIIAPLLPASATPAQERACYQVAALIAACAAAGFPVAPPGPAAPDGEPPRSLGHALGTAARHAGDATALERLAQDLARQPGLDGLCRLLPRIVPRLGATRARIDWEALIDDMARWDDDSRQVAMEWMQDYYRAAARRPAPQSQRLAYAGEGHDPDEETES